MQDINSFYLIRKACVGGSGKSRLVEEHHAGRDEERGGKYDEASGLLWDIFMSHSEKGNLGSHLLRCVNGNKRALLRLTLNFCLLHCQIQFLALNSFHLKHKQWLMFF